MRMFAYPLLGLSLGLSIASYAAEPGITDGGILLGMVNAQTGPAASLGQGMYHGAMAAFDEVNARGGVNGRKITLILDDDGYEPDRAIAGTRKMIDEKRVFALFGYVGTPTANAVLPIVKETHVPLIGVFSGAMTLRQPVTPEVINIRPSYDDETETLVDHFVNDTGAKRFAVFYQNDGFGAAVLSGVDKALRKRNLDIVAKGAFERNTIDVAAGLAAVKQGDPDVVIMAGPYSPLTAFVKAAKEQNLKAQLATVSFVGTEAFVNSLGVTDQNVFISQVMPYPGDITVPVVATCTRLMQRYYPNEALGFINLEGCVTAKALLIALEKTGRDLTREGLLKSFEGLHHVDLHGLDLTFAEDDHQALSKVFLTRIDNGKIWSITDLKVAP